MTDQSVNPFDLISPVDHSVPETGPSGRPIVRTEEGIVTEGSKVNGTESPFSGHCPNHFWSPAQYCWSPPW